MVGWMNEGECLHRFEVGRRLFPVDVDVTGVGCTLQRHEHNSDLLTAGQAIARWCGRGGRGGTVPKRQRAGRRRVGRIRWHIPADRRE